MKKWIVFYTWYDPNEWNHSSCAIVIQADSEKDCRKIVYSWSESNFGEFYMDSCVEATEENLEKYKDKIKGRV